MSEYIERAAVAKMLEDAQLISDGEYCGYCTEDVSLNSIPAADVAEVRHGQLNFVQEDMPYCYYGTCSVCGAYVQAWNYCPSCGTRMDKEDDHEISQH